MGFRVRLLHFVEPISALDSRGSFAGDLKVGGGAAVAESIRRVPQGYLLGWKNKVYFIPDTRISCAEIVDEEAEVTLPPRPEHVTPIQSAASVAAAAPLPTVTPVVEAPPPPPEPGSIVMDKFGRYSRVPFPEPPKPATPPAAAEKEPSPDEPAYTMSRRGRGRRSMTDQHAPQAPTALEAAVAAEESE